MAPQSSTIAWKIPWTEEPGWLQTMGSRRVGHDWSTSLSLFPFMHWRRKWQPTPVFLPGESQGRGAWWAAVYGVAQSRTWLKRLSSSSTRMGFPGGTSGKEPTCLCRLDVRDSGSIPGSRGSSGGGHSNPVQYSCLENLMDRGAWRAVVHMVAQSWMWLKSLSTHIPEWLKLKWMTTPSVDVDMQLLLRRGWTQAPGSPWNPESEYRLVSVRILKLSVTYWKISHTTSILREITNFQGVTTITQ